MKPRIASGFTLTEMVVVIAIIGILVGIMFPVLTAVRMRAKKTEELNLMGHVIKAWTLYSVGHQERILPGYFTIEVQEYHKQAWAFPNESIVPPATAYDTSLPNTAGPWTWRLLDYLDYDWRSLLFYRDVDWEEWGGQLTDHADTIAMQPAFGYNGYYLGGWWSIDTNSNRPKMQFSSVRLLDERVINVVAKVAPQIRKPDGQLVFCSTTFVSEGVHDSLPNDIEGSYFANPSILALEQTWRPIQRGRITAFTETHIPLGRFNGMPAIGFADGHTDNLEVTALLDQRLWIPKAQTVGDIPASEFSHSY